MVGWVPKKIYREHEIIYHDPLYMSESGTIVLDFAGVSKKKLMSFLVSVTFQMAGRVPPEPSLIPVAGAVAGSCSYSGQPSRLWFLSLVPNGIGS